MASGQVVYRVVFEQNEKIRDVYACGISEDALLGFIEVSELVWTQPASAIVVNTQEEQTRTEFKGVERFYVPMHSVLRIDVLDEAHGATLLGSGHKGAAAKVSYLPNATQAGTTGPSSSDEKGR